MASLRRKIREWAIFSRLFLFVIQIFLNLIFPDHQSDGFQTPSEEEPNFFDSLASFICKGLTHWDGQHFLHIANYGYTYENNLAFFPLYPLLIKTVANTFGYPLQFLFSYHSVLIISALIISFVSFVASAELLYELSRRVLQEEKLAYRATLLYCINPASVFFSAVYTESLFALCVFAGMLFYEQKRIYVSSVCFAIGSAVRSNGIINCGFPLYHITHQIMKNMNLDKQKKNISNYISIFHVIKLLLCLCIIVIPFLAHQIYAYKRFCDDPDILIPSIVREYSLQNDLVMPSSDTKPSWCFDSLPSSYNKIQEKYWNVGFLRYYEIKQIPNFLLATPITLLLIYGTTRYSVRNKKTVSHLGFEFGNDKSTSIGFDSCFVFVYIVHAVVQLTLGWMFINVQVVTRFLCASSPFVYWCAAAVILDDETNIPLSKFSSETVLHKVEKASNFLTKKNVILDLILDFPHWSSAQRVILIYFLSYFILGTLMFVNELPFT